MKTICIDARLWGTKNTGPGRYTQELINHLPKDAAYRVLLIVSPENQNHPDLLAFPKVVARHHPYSFLAQLEMGFIGLKFRPDLLHSTHFTVPLFWPGKVIVTIHDLIKHYSRGRASTTRNSYYYWIKYLAYRFNVWFAVHRSSHILVPSKYWADRLVQLYHLNPANITVTYEGVSSGFLNTADSAIDIPDHQPYVLHVGNVYPHKNILTVIEAIKILNGQVLLILVCPRTVFLAKLNQQIDRLEVKKWVRIFNYLSDTDLQALYRSSLAYVFPSFIEGFGLPGLEAMAAGSVVLASNSSCLPEIYGSAALYFDPHRPQEIVDLINRLRTEPGLRQKMLSAGKSQLKKYSWAKMAKLTWTNYLKILP